MNFGFSEEQELLRSTARKFFDNECASETVRKLMDGPEGMTPELWKKIAEQGWTGLIFPDEHGGMGKMSPVHPCSAIFFQSSGVMPSGQIGRAHV